MKFLEARRLKRAGGGEVKARRPFYEDKALRGRTEEELAAEATMVEAAREVEASGAVAWPLRMAPKTYLALHPTGQWADLARALEGAGDAESS